MLRLRSPSLGGAGGDTRRRDRKGGRAPFDARTTSSPQERLAPARHARAIRRRCAARRPGPRGALAPHLGRRRRSGAGGERRRLHIRPRLGSRPGERQGWLTAAGDLPRRCTPPRRRREPPPAASRLPPRGLWRWTQLRRSAPPIYSTETRVTAGRATGLVDGRRRPSTALHAAQTSPRAGAGCVATTESARHARARGAATGRRATSRSSCA